MTRDIRYKKNTLSEIKEKQMEVKNLNQISNDLVKAVSDHRVFKALIGQKKKNYTSRSIEMQRCMVEARLSRQRLTNNGQY